MPGDLKNRVIQQRGDEIRVLGRQLGTQIIGGTGHLYPFCASRVTSRIGPDSTTRGSRFFDIRRLRRLGERMGQAR